jgi:hypothetical protein
MLVFADPFALVEQDRIEAGELRRQTLGLVGGVALRLVAHTVHSGAAAGCSHGPQWPRRRNDPDHFCPQGHTKGTPTL